MTRRIALTLALTAFAFAIACSRNPGEPTAALPTSPTLAASDAGGGVSGSMVVTFPQRSDGIVFRVELENKYFAMGRRPAEVYVDQEGEATWIGEYYRYRVNGCDHNNATARVMAQIDGQGAAPICSLLQFPENAQYPTRDQAVDFRRQLGAKYQAMGRHAQSLVDQDGAAVWVGEYYRYRSSGCDHAQASQKTLTQIDGYPVPPTCLGACSYSVGDSPRAISSAAGLYGVQLIRTSGTCDWVATTDTPWIVLNQPLSGSDRGSLLFNVAGNNGVARAGTITFTYPGGATYLEVRQGSFPYTLQFQLFDPAVAATPTTQCLIRTTATTCTLNLITSTVPVGPVTYNWQVEYSYNGSKIKAQTTQLPTFSFTETCGPQPPEGEAIPMKVTLSATDSNGNTATIYSGQGLQPALQMRVFSCP